MINTSCDLYRPIELLLSVFVIGWYLAHVTRNSVSSNLMRSRTPWHISKRDPVRHAILIRLL